MQPVPESAVTRIDEQAVNLLTWQMDIALFELGDAGEWTPVERSSQGTSETVASLLASAKARTVELPDSTISFAVDLRDFYLIDRVFLEAKGQSGSLRLAFADDLLSPENNGWARPIGPAQFSNEAPTDLGFSPVEARFVWITVEGSAPLSISALSLFGDLTLADVGSALPPFVSWPMNTDTNLWQTIDLGSRPAGARVTHLSRSGLGNPNALIDTDPATLFSVESAPEPFYFLVELADVYPVMRAALHMDPAAGRLALYGFTQLPEALEVSSPESDESFGKIRIPSDFTETYVPLASVHLEEPTDYAELNIEGHSLKYALVQWTTNPHTLSATSFSIYGNVPAPFDLYTISNVLTAPDLAPAEPQTNPTPEVPDRLVPASQ